MLKVYRKGANTQRIRDVFLATLIEAVMPGGKAIFVARILAQSQERYETRYALKARGVDLKDVAARVAELLGMQAEQVWQAGKTRPQVKARRLLCYWAVRELEESMTAMARRLGISTAAVSKAIKRGAEIASQNGYSIHRN